MPTEFVDHRRKVFRAELERVAEVYREAARVGERPAKAVKNDLGCTQSTASRRIAAARAAGLLDPYEVETYTFVNVKAFRIAEALGVSYPALMAAIREHANGDLRLGELA